MAKMGQPFEPGEEVFVFVYQPKTSFYYQRAKIVKYMPEDEGYILKATDEPISTMVDSKGYPVDVELAVRRSAVKSKTYAKNVLKQYGKRLIADIFENIYKRKRK